MGRQQNRKIIHEINKEVLLSQEPVPVTTRQATTEELNKNGNPDYIPYDDCYSKKYNSYWKSVERKAYGK